MLAFRGILVYTVCVSKRIHGVMENPMRAKTPIVPVRLHKAIVAQMDAEIRRCNQRMRVPYTRSSWIRWAILMQLQISRQRSKVGKGIEKFKCTLCHKQKPRTELAHKIEGLFGDIDMVCSDCSRGPKGQ